MLRIQSGNPYMRGCIDNASSVARGGCVLTSADAAMYCKQLLLLAIGAIPGKDSNMLLLTGIAPIVPAVLTPPPQLCYRTILKNCCTCFGNISEDLLIPLFCNCQAMEEEMEGPWEYIL